MKNGDKKHSKSIMNILGGRDFPAWGMLIIAILFFILTVIIGNKPKETERIANKVGKTIEKRMDLLDKFIDKAAQGEPDKWMDLEDLPNDMVIYRYRNDSLQSWANQFPIANDDISKKLAFQRLTNMSDRVTSPLSDVGELPEYVNYGPGWFLVKAVEKCGFKIIAGLEIKDDLQTVPITGLNKKLNISPGFSTRPLSYSGGDPVFLDGRPLFKIISSYHPGQTAARNSRILLISLLLLIPALLFYLSRNKTLTRFRRTLEGILLTMVGIYFSGRNFAYSSLLFSPTLYADGSIFYSLGGLLTINTLFLLIILCSYMMRFTLYRKVEIAKTSKKEWKILLLASLLFIAYCFYVFVSFKSIIMNSGISLELYKINTLDIYTGIVYISYILLAIGAAFIAQMVRPFAKKCLGIKFNIFSVSGRTVCSILTAVFLVTVSSILGFKKEINRVDVWAGRLSIDRDISLEIQLRTMENSIANDAVIASLVNNKNSARTIYNRISEYYMYRIAQDYDLHIYFFNDNDRSATAANFFNERIRNGIPLADNSRFMYSRNSNGHARYTGMFTYVNKKSGINRMFIGVESKSNREDRGYASILGYEAPGKVILPQIYSYAKYLSEKLVNFKGNYAYPTILTSSMSELVYSKMSHNIILDGHNHFINKISEDEAIIISRPKTEIYKYLVATFFLGIISYLLLSLIGLRRKKPKAFKKNYYKSRINTVLMASLILTLLVMVAISVLFVHKRNEANINTMMSNKINSIQALVENKCRYINNWQELSRQEFAGEMDEVANTIKTDITLYTTGGRAFQSTLPEVFNKMIIGPRLNKEAYSNIIYKNKRYYIRKEKHMGHKYYSLSAPVFNSAGKMIAILSSPYTDEDYAFKTAAAFNIMTMITAFIILLILARLMTTKVVDKMFMPLITMGKKMNAANIDSLEYIIYERDDEISTLVRAYNLMVHDLYESTKQLTQAERDKAWATMARQVAHEIKNPLTPIKLQIQRVIRLKQKGNPAWIERFDSMSKEVLLQIDILADTANEFSTFAKLYTEEPVKIDIDALLKNEISLFDSKDNISFSYMGLDGATIMGPKPQLIRVFVNLINNAIQAIELNQDENQGKILISLRYSATDGYYDIVIEDNGPGVKEENRAYLFTPNFTTKNSGTGLGLSICRNILEKCGATIEYSKSFALRGACFTIKYPYK